MSRKVKVPVHGKVMGTAMVEDGATEGAIVGVNLRTRDGRIIQESDLGGGTTVVQQASPGGGVFSTLWRLIREIPANIVALADLATTGLVARTGAGTFATRTVTGTAGRIGVANGDGVAGNPTVDLATLADSGVGAALVKITRDGYGRLSGTQAATTSDLAEGTNLYYTDARADARAAAAVATHEGAADPHPGYALESSLGTMASQDATAVNIDGGTIDGTVIGGDTPAAGSFTTLDATGAVELSTSSGNTTVGGAEPSAHLPAKLNLLNVADEASSTVLNMYKARGSAGSETDLLAGDVGGAIRTYLRNNSTYVVGSNIRTRVADATAGSLDTELEFAISENGSVSLKAELVADGLQVFGNTSTDTAFLVNDVHALTAVTTTSQTRTLDLSNGAVQTLSANQNFTLNATGPSSKHGRCYLYVYNPSGGDIGITAGTGWASTIATGPFFGVTMLYLLVWSGSHMWYEGFTSGSGDLRPT